MAIRPAADRTTRPRPCRIIPAAPPRADVLPEDAPIASAVPRFSTLPPICAEGTRGTSRIISISPDNPGSRLGCRGTSTGRTVRACEGSAARVARSRVSCRSVQRPWLCLQTWFATPYVVATNIWAPIPAPFRQPVEERAR
jgi:hypothetical protein